MSNLKQQIEELLYNNASDFQIAKVLKQDIQEYIDNIEYTFQTSGGKDFLVKHTKKIDSILKLIYKIVYRDMFGDFAPMKNSIPISLIALGSYGREQLCVHSDIDIMFVYEDVKGYNSKDIIEKILYILWDTGLKIGHRVHTVNELYDVSKTDITIKTSLIESRFIEGSSFIWSKTQNEISKIRHDNVKEFILDKLLEQKDKHEKYPLTMEPHLKEGVGGFRDANLVYWLGKIAFNADSIKDIPLNIITNKEYRSFRISLEFLFRVRSALHIVSKKKEDRLRLELLPDVSLLLGYQDNKESHMKLARKVTSSIKVIRLYSLIWINALSSKYIDINYDLVYPGNKIKDLDSLISEMSKYAVQPFKVHPTFLQQLIHAEKPMTLTSHNYKTIKNIFYTNSAYSILNTLSYAKLIKYLFAPMKKAIDLPQFDGYHMYNVDIHSLKSLYHVETIQDPYIEQLFNNLNKDEQAILKLIIYLHDAGKGRIKDHHKIGASLFKTFAKNLNFDNNLIKIGEQLILHHTLMSNVSQREDIENEKTLLKFIAYFKTKKLLDMIYILTYADMNGVGNNIYNNYVADLLKNLYINSLSLQKHKSAINDTSKRLKQEKVLMRNVEFTKLSKREQKLILNIPSNFIFLRYSASEIVEISKKSFNIENYSFTLNNDNFLSIEIFKSIPMNLAYLLHKLSNLNIVHMDIAKITNSIKYLKIEFSEQVSSHELTDVEQIIINSFNSNQTFQSNIPSINNKDISIDCEHSKSLGKLSLNVKDQSGLLAYVIEVFDSLNIDIASAKLHTLKNKTKDIFLIEKNGNFCHNIDIIMSKLTAKGL